MLYFIFSVGYRPRREGLAYWIILVATWHSILLFAGNREKYSYY
jgi:hypothetical protein